MVLAANSGNVFAIALGAFAALCLLVYVIRPRDVTGRRRAIGCTLCLVLFFGPIVAFFSVWAANHVF